MSIRSGYDGPPSSPVIDYSKCTSCGLCVKVCGLEILKMDGGRVSINDATRFSCIGCGHCMMACPSDCIAVEGRKASPSSLLSLPGQDDKATPDSLESLLLSRRSIREFLPLDIENDVIDRILRIASTAPMSLPPTNVGILAVRGQKAVRALGDDISSLYSLYLKAVNPATLMLARPFMGKAFYDIVGTFGVPLARTIVEKRKSGVDFLFYDAPLVLIFHYLPSGLPEDTYIAGTYAMLAAESMGLGSCVIGIPHMIGYHPGFKARHGIPKANRLGMTVAIGYPALHYKKAIRREFASIRYVEK